MENKRSSEAGKGHRDFQRAKFLNTERQWFMNVYEVEFREKGYMAHLARYRPVAESLEAAILAASTQGSADYQDIFTRGGAEMVSARELARDVLMPQPQKARRR